jgi:hypothetical protein
MARNAECSTCGVTAADLPWEEMGLPDLDEASDLLFETSGGETYCQGCAP